MFGFLKKKLGEALGKFTKAAVEESVEESPEKLPEKIKEDEYKKIDVKNAKEIKKEKKEHPKDVIKKQSKESEHKKEPLHKPIPKKEEQEKTEEKNKPKQGFFSKLFGKKDSPKVEEIEENEEEEKVTKEEIVDVIEEEKEEAIEKETEPIKEEVQETIKEKIEVIPAEENKSFFGKITETFTKVTISNEKFDELFWDIEVACLENNVALEVIEKIKADLKEDLVSKKLNRANLADQIMQSMKKSVVELFDVEELDLLEKVKEKKPYVITLIGVNGAGKTTTVAKIVHMLKKHNLKSVIGACDTFRAAAIQQLEAHANKLGVKMIRHDYGADPAVVAFDTIEHAKAKGIDVVLLDTAGRLHSNTNLMDELKKIIRVAKPDLNIFIGESIAGNDLVEQVKLFNSSVGIDGIILSKADVDEKGGAAISVTYVTKKPILYIGTGQEYDDLIPFDKEKIIKQIGIES
ncbi:MAG: signal recognition particle-docking protein FtsY [archaeon]